MGFLAALATIGLSAISSATTFGTYEHFKSQDFRGGAKAGAMTGLTLGAFGAVAVYALYSLGYAGSTALLPQSPTGYLNNSLGSVVNMPNVLGALVAQPVGALVAQPVGGVGYYDSCPTCTTW